jgi:hypothetical protein
MRGGLHVQVDVTREIKTTVDWRFYPCFEIDDRQASIFIDRARIVGHPETILLSPVPPWSPQGFNAFEKDRKESQERKVNAC